MKAKKICLTTKRLLLQPMTDEETVVLIEQCDSEEMRQAYGEMLEGCKRDPENRIWYAPWKMLLKDSKVFVGDLCFKGPAKNGAVEVGYGILPKFEGIGYMTEAVKAITKWAFAQKDVLFVEAETDPENKASQRVLEKCGFKPDGTGKEGPRFVLESPPTNWMTVYMCLGMSIGMALGMQQDQMMLGMSIGMSVGVRIGMMLDASDKSKREKFRKERKK